MWAGLGRAAGCSRPRRPLSVCMCVPLFQRRSLAPSQLAKRKAGDEEEEEEEEADRHPPTVSEGPRDVAASAGGGDTRALRCRGRPGPGGVRAGSAPCDARRLSSRGPGDGVRGGGGPAAAQVSQSLVPDRKLLPPPSSGE